MRIVAGKHKGRPISAPKNNTTRPTSDRAREAIFNVLTHGIDGLNLDGAMVIDVFAGTGAMGLEAISRGAKQCVFIEPDPKALDVLNKNISNLGENVCATVIKTKAEKAPIAKTPVDIAFLDAPYDKGLSVPALVHLETNGWFNSGAIVVVEISSSEEFSPPDRFEIIKEKNYGAAKTIFLSFTG